MIKPSRRRLRHRAQYYPSMVGPGRGEPRKVYCSIVTKREPRKPQISLAPVRTPNPNAGAKAFATVFGQSRPTAIVGMTLNNFLFE